MRFLQSVRRKGVGKQQYKEAPPWLRRSGFYSEFFETGVGIKYRICYKSREKRKDDFGYILIIEYGETSSRNLLRYTSLVARGFTF